MTYLGFRARLSALLHKLRHPSHRIFWRIDSESVCDGDLICDDCDRVYWCRMADLSDEEIDRRLKQKVN